MGSRVVIDQQALATGCVHRKRTVPDSNVVKKMSKLHVLDKRNTSWFLSMGIPSIICVIEIDFIIPFNF